MFRHTYSALVAVQHCIETRENCEGFVSIRRDFNREPDFVLQVERYFVEVGFSECRGTRNLRFFTFGEFIVNC